MKVRNASFTRCIYFVSMSRINITYNHQCHHDKYLSALALSLCNRLLGLSHLQYDNCSLLTTSALAAISKLTRLNTLSLVINSEEPRPQEANGGELFPNDNDAGDGHGWAAGDGGGVGDDPDEGDGLGSPTATWEAGGEGFRHAQSSLPVDAGVFAALTPLAHLVELELSIFFRRVPVRIRGWIKQCFVPMPCSTSALDR